MSNSLIIERWPHLCNLKQLKSKESHPQETKTNVHEENHTNKFSDLPRFTISLSYLLLTIFYMIYFFLLFISFPTFLLFFALLLCSFFLAPCTESTTPFIEHCQRRCFCVTTHQCLASEPIKYSEKTYKLYPFLWNFHTLIFLLIP